MHTRYLKRAKRNDRWARWVITLGGVSIILSVVFILVLIVRMALPLFLPAKAEVFARLSLQPEGAPPLVAAGVDEYLEAAFAIDPSGRVRFVDPRLGTNTAEQQLVPPAGASHLVAADAFGRREYSLLWDNGALDLVRIDFHLEFDPKGARNVRPEVKLQGQWAAAAETVPVRSLARQLEELRLRVDQLDDRRLRVSQQISRETLLGDLVEESFSAELAELAEDDRLTALALDEAGRMLYAGSQKGMLLRWNLREPGAPKLLDKMRAFIDGRGITALAMLYGDESLAVGDSAGGVSTWFEVPAPEYGGDKRLRLIHPLKQHDSPIRQLVPSRRNKGLLSLDEAGILHLDYATSERHLLRLQARQSLTQVAFSSRDNGLLAVDAAGHATLWTVDNPHPDVSWKTLFGKVWYEGYPASEYAWQSSSSVDDFEPKKSMVPLIFGTIKGTFYAMLFALPVALLGAVYVSQFASPRSRELIKPTVEIMAAIPSVVVGFLAALWLAPLLERNLVALFVSLALIPAVFLLTLLGWQALRDRFSLTRLERGNEFLLMLPVLLVAVALSWQLGPWVEALLFGGNFKLWLFNATGLRYDSRNCLVIALALGFAVIPIIFTIAEDALSNVPKPLKAASLALGASRWQTVWRVILPSASPGIFAGTMIGLGRAIGETMIVLMATGNTAIMDWSPFNGMRPLSSNIAVEVPEAPVGSSLYRVLFLSAVILFLMTFVLNTVAEIVRQQLRRKYGRFQ